MKTYCVFWSEFGNDYFEDYTRTIVKAASEREAIRQTKRITPVYRVVRYVFDITEYV